MSPNYASTVFCVLIESVSHKTKQQCEYDLHLIPELRMADHHPTAPVLPHREGGELWQVLHVIVDQVSQSAG